MSEETCTCPDPWCVQHAVCGICGTQVIIMDDDPAFCPDCGMDVMPARACGLSSSRWNAP